MNKRFNVNLVFNIDKTNFLHNYSDEVCVLNSDMSLLNFITFQGEDKRNSHYIQVFIVVFI